MNEEEAKAIAAGVAEALAAERKLNEKKPEPIQPTVLAPASVPAPAPEIVKAPEAPKAPEPIPAPDPAKAEIEALRAEVKGQDAILRSIAEKVSGLVLNTEVKGQTDTLKDAIGRMEALARDFTKPPVPDRKGTPTPAPAEVIEWNAGGVGKESINARAERLARQWGVEPAVPEEIPVTIQPVKDEVDPVKVELNVLRGEVAGQSASLKAVADKIDGLVNALTKAPVAQPAPEQAVPAPETKRSVATDALPVVDWDSAEARGGSITERAERLARQWGGKKD